MKTKNIKQLLVEIQELSRQYGRSEKSVTLLAVSKTRTASEIEKLVDQGQVCFGENYLQEAIEKIQSLQHRNLEWHYIGKIQSNKTRQIATHFDWVHTVDRLKIAQRLNDQRPENLPPIKICLQVNSSGEDSKGGVSFDALPDLALKVSQLPNIELRGLMTLPAPADDIDQQRLPFRTLHKALDSLRQQGLELDTLSMGTTNDFEAAIAEGATMIRIGTALFGPRN